MSEPIQNIHSIPRIPVYSDGEDFPSDEKATEASPLLLATKEKTDGVAENVILVPSEPSGLDNFRKGVDFVTGRVKKYSSLFDIQDSGQSLVRNSMTLTMTVAGSSSVFLTHAIAVDSGVCSLAYMVVRGFTLQEAIRNFPTVWRHGDFYDKLDAMCVILRSAAGVTSSGLGVGKAVGKFLAWTALAIPAAVAGCVFLILFAIRSMMVIYKHIQTYIELNRALAGADTETKITGLVNYLKQVDLAMEAENDLLRGTEYMDIKAQMEGEEDPETLARLNEQLEQNKKENPERELFLRQRRLTWLSFKFGTKAVKRLQEYAHIEETLKQYNKLAEGDRPLPQDVLAHKAEFLEKAEEWFSDVKWALGSGILLQALLGGASILGCCGAIFGVLTAKFWVPVSLAVSMVASILWIGYDIVTWKTNTEVTSHQNKWVREILAEYFKEFRYDEAESRRLAAHFGIEEDKYNHEKNPLSFHLFANMLEDPSIDDDIDSNFIEYLKKHADGTISEDEKQELKKHITGIIVSYGKDDKVSRKAIKQSLHVDTFVEHYLKQSPQLELIANVLNNRHYEMAQLATTLQSTINPEIRTAVANAEAA